MARRVFLHIGRAKTGSTAIQRALSANRRLLRVLGYAFPGRGLDHYEVLPDFAGPAADELLEEVRAFGGDVILSTEGLQNADPHAVRRWLCGQDVQVIVYLREQAELLASGWAQEIHGTLQTCSLEDYVRGAGIVDYCEFLAPWAEAFGKQNLIVRIYDRSRFPQQDIVADFLKIVGLPVMEPFFLDHLPNSNPTIAGELLEAKRRINATWGKSEAELLSVMYEPLMMLANTNKQWRGLTLNPEIAAWVREKHRACNARLARDYLGCEIAFSDAGAAEVGPAQDATVVRLPLAG